MDLIASLQVNVDRLVTAANLDDLAVERTSLLNRPQLFFRMARPAGELNQLRLAANDVAYRIVFSEFVVKILDCFPRRLRPTAISYFLDPLVDLALRDLIYADSHNEATLLQFSEVDVFAVPEQFREVRHVIG
jgi:hypothetical protein